MNPWLLSVIGVFLIVIIIVVIRFIYARFSRKRIAPTIEEIPMPITPSIGEVVGAAEELVKPEVPQPGLRLGNGLIIINVVSVVLILVTIWLPLPIIRIIFSIPFLLFTPGYAFIVAFFPGRRAISGIERLMLSFTLSLAIVPLIGIVLNFVSNISLKSVLFSTVAFIFIVSVVAWFREISLPRQERLNAVLRLTWPGFSKLLGEGIWNKITVSVLTITLLGSLGLLYVRISSPRITEKYTQFYLLGQEGKFEYYPSEFNVGEAQTLQVGVVNHEGKTVNYRLALLIEGKQVAEKVVSVNNTTKWEGGVSFLPDQSGTHQKLELILYEGDEKTSRLAPLQLWVDIRGPSESTKD